MKICIIGFGFIGKEIYYNLIKQEKNVTYINYTNLNAKAIPDDIDVFIYTASANTNDLWTLEQSYKKISSHIEKIKDKKIVFISSQQVHGYNTGKTIEYSNHSFYKKKLEHLIKDSVKNYAIIRLPNIIGESCLPFKNSIISTWIVEKNNIVHDQVFRHYAHVSSILKVINDFCYDPIDKKIIDIIGKKIQLTTIADLIEKKCKNKFIIKKESSINESIYDTKLLEETIEVKLDIEKSINNMVLYKDIGNIKKIKRYHTNGDYFLLDLEKYQYPNNRVYCFNVHNELRGGHYHKKQTEYMSLLQGEALVVLKHIASERYKISHMHTGEIIEIPKLFIHEFMGVSKDPSIFLVSSDQSYIENKKPDTFIKKT